VRGCSRWNSADGPPKTSNCYCLPGRAGGPPQYVREVTNREPLLEELANIYINMPNEWTPSRNQPGTDKRSVLRRMQKSVSSPNEALLVAESGAGLVGFAWVVNPRLKQEMLHLRAIWVRRDERGTGLGSVLLRHVEEKALALGASVLTSQVHGFNARMLAFILRQRFRVGYLAVEKDLHRKE
jgi:GNAT superfamily N-acetyltransferase